MPNYIRNSYHSQVICEIWVVSYGAV